MECSIETITPDMAKNYLGKNVNNFRKIDRARVKRYASAMANGEWMENGDTIRFNGDTLLDGQHRLAAIVESGKTIRCIVVNDIESIAAKTMDRGQPRTIPQWLKHTQHKNAKLVASIARNCVLYNHGLWADTANNAASHTDGEVIEFAEKYRSEIQETIQVARLAHPVCPHGLLCSVLLIASDYQSPKQYPSCEWFCKSLGDGLGLSDLDPVYHLRNRLLFKSNDRYLTAFMTKQYITTCWNRTALDQPMKLLRLVFTGPQKTIPANKIEFVPELR